MAQAASRLAKQMKIAVVGATGFLGREVLKAMDESELLLVEPLLLAEGEDVGEVLTCQGADVTADNLEEADFNGVHVALFCADAATTRKYAPKAMQAGAMVIDACGAIRGEGVLLQSPEKLGKPDTLKEKGGVLPNPLASTLATVLGAIHEKSPLARAYVSTYQTVAGAGLGAVEEVAEQSVGLLGGAGEGGFSSERFAHQAAFNVLPHVGEFADDGCTTTEKTIAEDFNALFGELPLSVGCAYVPTFVGDAMDLALEFKGSAPGPEALREMFSPASGVMVLDNPAENEYATPYGAAETSYIFLSRVRRDPAHENGLRLWLVADHIRVAQARVLVKYAEAIAHQMQ